MKPEKEFKFIIRMLNSNYIKDGLFSKPKGGCKKDYEKLVGASESDKEFYEWINELINFGVLESCGIDESSKGKEIEHYIINYNLLVKIAENNKIYKESYKFFDSKSNFGLNV